MRAAAPPAAVDPVVLQADALVADINGRLAARRQELLAAAAAEAAAVRRAGRDKARRQLRRAVAEMRAAERQSTQQLDADIEGAGRRAASTQAVQALAAAWPMLEAAVAARWADPVARQAWITALLAAARARWPGGGWTVRHPPTLDAAEFGALPPGCSVRADAALSAGLVVDADAATLDATPVALVADRPRVEAALLAALEPAAGAR